MRIVVMIFVFLIGLGTAQTSKSTPTVPDTLERMKSGSWTDRKKAFEDAAKLAAANGQSPDSVERLRIGIFQLLATENSDKTPVADEREGEENSQYYASLIDFVAHSGDQRGISALLGATMTGGIAIRGVARFGNKALDPVLQQAAGKDPKLASGAVYVIQKMLEMRTVRDPDSHLRIKNTLRSALASPDSGVRQAAIFAVEYLEDREEFVPVLKELADHDPDKLPGQMNADGSIGDFYVVREQAAKLLRKIASHEPPAIDQGVSE